MSEIRMKAFRGIFANFDVKIGCFWYRYLPLFMCRFMQWCLCMLIIFLKLHLNESSGADPGN